MRLLTYQAYDRGATPIAPDRPRVAQKHRYGITRGSKCAHRIHWLGIFIISKDGDEGCVQVMLVMQSPSSVGGTGASTYWTFLHSWSGTCRVSFQPTPYTRVLHCFPSSTGTAQAARQTHADATSLLSQHPSSSHDLLWITCNAPHAKHDVYEKMARFLPRWRGPHAADTIPGLNRAVGEQVVLSRLEG